MIVQDWGDGDPDGDGVDESQVLKWVTWCDVIISLINLLALLLPLFLMMIKGNNNDQQFLLSFHFITSWLQDRQNYSNYVEIKAKIPDREEVNCKNC